MRKHTALKQMGLSGLLCMSILTVSSSSFATDVSIGRYLTVAEKPQPAQQHLLQQRIQIKFPANILTIEQAMELMLQFSGYQLADVSQMHPATRAMLNQRLPAVDRILGPMTLEQGLIMLAGNAFYLLVDPVHRLIAFQIKPIYRNLYV